MVKPKIPFQHKTPNSLTLVRACPYMSTYRFGTLGTRYLLCHNNIIIWGTRYVMYYYDIIDGYKFLISSGHITVQYKGLLPTDPSYH